MEFKRKVGLALVVGWTMTAYAALTLCLPNYSARPAYAEGGSATVPFYVRRWQGVGRIFKEVNCASTGDTELVSAAEASGALSMYFYNTAAATSAAVTICPRVAGTAQCNDPTDGLTLPINSGYTADVAVRDAAWSCDGTGGTTIVEVYIEKAATPNPTPTPLT